MSTATDLVNRALVDTGGNITNYPRARLLLYVNDAIASLADMLSQNPECGWFKWDEEITVAANTEEIDLIDSLTYTPAEIRSLFHVRETGIEIPMTPMQPGSYGAYKRASAVPAAMTPCYGERRPPMDPETNVRVWNLVVLPKADAARTIHVYYRFVPDLLVEASGEDPASECPFDRRWDELIGKGAARKALTGKGLGEGQYDSDLSTLLAAFLQAESRTIGGDVPQGTKEVVAPYVWDGL